MTDVTLGIRWALGVGPPGAPPRAVEENLLGLLEAIEAGGSLRRAAREVGVSYRYAWGLLADWEGALGSPLVRLERGRGARLAPLGAAFLRERRRVTERLGPTLRRLALEAADALAGARPAAGPAPLVLFASHSLVVESLRDLAAREDGAGLELHVCGSIEALRRLHAGECDLAGFHVPAGSAAPRLARHYRRWLDPERHRLVRVVARRQGLMTAAGNPLGLRDLTDLARPGVRFINRQPESGTRLLLDDLLARAGVDPRAVTGYRDEEHTHTAVASMVASGAADAGFGIAAAAARFRLDFMPLAWERYCLAVDRDRLDEPGVAALVRLLGAAAFRDAVAALPGYDPADAGRVVPVEAVLGGG
jgi:putative molybdopterin biosynthesis protein